MTSSVTLRRLLSHATGLLLVFLIQRLDFAEGISVPTGKQTPITPARVTPRPTYRPPTDLKPAPVREYTEENPEPAPLNPAWVPEPVKYFHVLRPNSIFYVPVRYINPEYRRLHPEVSDDEENNGLGYQGYFTFGQHSAPVRAAASSTTTTTSTTTAQPTTVQPSTAQPQRAAYQLPTQEEEAAEEKLRTMEYGAKLSPKSKYNKPIYFQAKQDLAQKQPTKGGYPKKAVTSPSYKYYYYLPYQAQ